MNETTAARLESTGARVRALLGRRAGGDTALESAAGSPEPPGDADVRLLADRIAGQSTTPGGASAAMAIASEIVARAQAAVDKLEASTGDASLNDDDVLALESVLHVRGRPAVRVLGARLESLDRHPGSDLWQIYITDHEDAMVKVAAATGAVVLTAPETVNRPWLQGSAWLVARDRVVTNRHVVLPPPNKGVALAETDAGGALRVRSGVSVEVTFDADDRGAAPSQRRKVTGVLFVAAASDPVDIAVLAIEPVTSFTPLGLIDENAPSPADLFVVGHPGLMAGVPSEVQAVFGNPDGRKRVSFGKRLGAGGRVGVFGHDASTIGGYSGAPVVGIRGDAVAGLHYYGDPVNGNLAVTAEALREHASYAHFGS